MDQSDKEIIKKYDAFKVSLLSQFKEHFPEAIITFSGESKPEKEIIIEPEPNKKAIEELDKIRIQKEKEEAERKAKEEAEAEKKRQEEIMIKIEKLKAQLKK